MLGKINSQCKEVTVVGGGISGLLAAYTLDRSGYEVTLYEKEPHLGGLIHTKKTPWGLAESAAHTILATQEVRSFFDELGVELVGVHGSSAKYIYRNGKFRRFPLNFREVIRIIFRFLKKSKTLSTSQTVQDWAVARLGHSAAEYLIAPMIQGNYGARASEISMSCAFPRGLRMPKGKMMAPKNGMGSVTDRLVEILEKRLGRRLKKNTLFEELPKQDRSNIVLCVPAYEAARLLSRQSPRTAQALEKISYTSLMSVTVFLKRINLKGVGVLIPESEGRKCLGILFTPFEGRAINDSLMSLTVLLGGSFRPELLDVSDLKIQKVVTQELAEILKIKPDIFHFEIHRWKKAIPKYNSDLLGLWKTAREDWCAEPGHVLFGNYTGQVSLRGMVESVLGCFF